MAAARLLLLLVGARFQLTEAVCRNPLFICCCCLFRWPVCCVVPNVVFLEGGGLRVLNTPGLAGSQRGTCHFEKLL